MRVVLFALNGSFSHTNLAVRCLRQSLEKEDFEVLIIEKNLRDRREDILECLYEAHADIYGFSCYIWNIEEMLGFAADLRGLVKNAKLLFGGPEVSFESERFSSLDFVDCIISGEGEEALAEICCCIREGRAFPKVAVGRERSMPNEGIYYRVGETDRELLYYESSRGCPYRCAYCLSSACGKLRAKAVESVLADLAAFEALGMKGRTLKFVDRTFNFDIGRANAIWRALLSEMYTGCYHFEICASLLNDESFEILEQFPKGKIQLEIGLQSTNPETLAAVSRHIKPSEVLAATKKIHDMGNIHVHLDLIAGLPYESYERFGRSFDEAYACADMLQLGFLKLLHGTALRRDAGKYGYIAMARPPYTVLCHALISREELYRLGGIADLLDRFYSSGRFERSLDFAISHVASPFAFFEGLLDHIAEKDGRSIRKISQPDAFGLLYGYVCEQLPSARLADFEEKLHADYASHETRQMPFSVIKKSGQL